MSLELKVYCRLIIIIGNSKWSTILDSGKAGSHVSRWYKYCSDQGIFKAVWGKMSPRKAKSGKDSNKEDSGKVKRLHHK